jgi:hypothetical protein
MTEGGFTGEQPARSPGPDPLPTSGVWSAPSPFVLDKMSGLELHQHGIQG